MQGKIVKITSENISNCSEIVICIIQCDTETWIAAEVQAFKHTRGIWETPPRIKDVDTTTCGQSEGVNWVKHWVIKDGGFSFVPE